jgi:hypothetical protein
VTSLLTRLTELEQAFIAVSDPLDLWLCIDGNYVRPATKQEAQMLDALPLLLEVVRTLEAKARYWNENAHVLTHGADGVMRECAASVVAALAPLLGEGDS